MNGDEKDVSLLERVMNLIPSVKDMQKIKTSKALKAYLDDYHLLIYPLLLWLITSNRSHLRKLTSSEIIKDVPTEHQFLMLSSPPAREEIWRRQKVAAEKKMGKGKGSLLFFHGSPIGNWHTILRTGLLTEGKSEGQQGLGASGKAIWMAQHFQTSVGYCTKGGYKAGWSKSMFGPDILCMAILEIVNDTSKGAAEGGSVNIINDVSIIATRYFLVFPSAIPHSTCLSTSIKPLG
eukprot:TRINITY_DN3876_c0_g1_i11.p1 TRINITY_DN3876_c0_g1~~TRINITY_DN3876_c0_g1_i11.p1  ORF type:complete len:235 (+),score=17.95 TRINITY_DN3876_c0_g1_i11:81-785(+)